MWALRRAAVHFRNRGLISAGSSRISCPKPDISACLLDNNNPGIIQPQSEATYGFLSSSRFFNSSSKEIRAFSSQTGEIDDDLEDGFSDLETFSGVIEAVISEEESDDDISEEEVIADYIQDELEAFDSVGEKTSPRTRASSEMTKVILSSPATSPVSKILDKWVEEGNEVTKTEATLAMLHLRKRRMFGKALELSEWLESKKCFEPTESSYASRVDLIAKMRGVHKAEQYIKEIPESFRGELVYRSLLANCVTATNVNKSEEIFNKMKTLGFPVTCFSCNQLLLLYKRTDKRKIADVLLLMEKENIKPTVFTYQVLIDVKGQSKDTTGMEQVVERLKAEGLKPTSQIQTSLARYYVASGMKEKAEDVLKELEGGDLNKNRWACQLVIPIYASLGKADEVERVWKVCEENPRLMECVSAIYGFGQLNRIKDAELAFEKLTKKVKKPSAKHYNSLLEVYANNKQLAKGKELVRKMGESGCVLGPWTWDAIVRLYVESGEVEKADSILMKAMGLKRGKPLFNTYYVILEKYAARGDVHNSEKIFMMMRRGGYMARLRQYQMLLEAYVNAGTPVYGFAERMKADNLFPNRELAGQLAKVDAFRKSAVSELLE